MYNDTNIDKSDKTETADDFGCGWSVTSLLVGLSMSAMPRDELPETRPTPVASHVKPRRHAAGLTVKVA